MAADKNVDTQGYTDSLISQERLVAELDRSKNFCLYEVKLEA